MKNKTKKEPYHYKFKEGDSVKWGKNIGIVQYVVVRHDEEDKKINIYSVKRKDGKIFDVEESNLNYN